MRVFGAICVYVVCSCVAIPLHGSSIINTGTRQWVQAATTGRADMLIFGDSIVNHGIMGWTGGIADALDKTVGIAGTGLVSQGKPGIYPGRAGGRALRDPAWQTPAPDALGGLGHLALSDIVMQAGDTQPGSLIAGTNLDAVEPQTNKLLDNTDAYDWQFWLASDADGGTIQANRAARTVTPNTRTFLESSALVPVTEGLQQLSLGFSETDTDGDWHEFSLRNTTNSTIFYHRLIAPERTGATVTGWGYSGFPTRDFVLDLYAPDDGGVHRSQEGRATHLAALVHGNSGKLNVVIAEGVNDAGETDPSLTAGITPGHSTEAFIDNVTTLIDMIRADWAFAGFEATDLSFTLLGPYQVDPARIGTERWNRLADYSDALHDLAVTNQQYSFIDMWHNGPDWTTAVAENHIHDGLHPSPEGAQFYGGIFVNELMEIPEPSVLALISILLFTCVRNRKIPVT